MKDYRYLSFDALTHCYFGDSRKVVEAEGEMINDPIEHWSLHTKYTVPILRITFNFSLLTFCLLTGIISIQGHHLI